MSAEEAEEVMSAEEAEGSFVFCHRGDIGSRAAQKLADLGAELLG